MRNPITRMMNTHSVFVLTLSSLLLFERHVDAQSASPSLGPTMSLAPSTAGPTAPSPTSSPTSSPTDVLLTPSPTPGSTEAPPPTVAPTDPPPTGNPTASPAISEPAPSTSPSGSPTKGDTAAPTGGTTTSPTSGPTATGIAPTAAPTETPTSLPTVYPSVTPSAIPSSAPSGMSAEPSAAPSDPLPTVSPTVGSTPSPTSGLIRPPEFEGLTMTMVGMQQMDESAQTSWVTVTAAYITEFYKENEQSLGLTDVASQIQFEDQSLLRRRRLGEDETMQQRRSLQGNLEVTYNHEIRYRTTGGTQVTPEQVILTPFASQDGNSAYVSMLKSTNNPAFENLQSTSPVSLPPEPEDSGGLSTAIWIGIGAGGGALLLALIAGGVYLSRRGGGKGYVTTNGEAPLSSVKGGAADDVSTLENPNKGMGVHTSNESLGGYGDQSVATVDYDYSKAYGGGGESSVVSSAGGTMGENTQGDNTMTSSALGASALGAGAMATGSFSDNDSYGDQYRDSSGNTKEMLIDVYAPPGKLGVVIDTPDDGAPVVHAIKETSVIADKLQVGDKLVAVDNEDVRSMTAIKVSKLISRKSANATRKLSIIRTVPAE